MWDESEFHIAPTGETPVGTPVLLSYGRIKTKPRGEGPCTSAAVIAPPGYLEDKTAKTIYNAVCQKLGPDFVAPPAGKDDLVCVDIGVDGCETNVCIVDMVEHGVGEHVFVLSHLCSQHGTSLVSTAGTKKLDITAPCFCLAKQLVTGSFRPALLNAAYGIIEAELVIIDEAGQPGWRPNPKHVRHSRWLLESLYINEAVQSQDHRAHGYTNVAVLRERAEQLITLCPGDWTQSDAGSMIHWCRGCCTSRSDSVLKVWTLVHTMFLGHFNRVADIKWTSLWSFIKNLAQPCNFHRLLQRSEEVVNGPLRRKKDADDGLSLGEDASGDWQKLRKKWSRRSGAFLQDTKTPALLAGFVALVTPIMVMHFTMFERGTNINADTSDTEPGFIFNLCDVASEALNHIQPYHHITACPYHHITI